MIGTAGEREVLIRKDFKRERSASKKGSIKEPVSYRLYREGPVKGTVREKKGGRERSIKGPVS